MEIFTKEANKKIQEMWDLLYKDKENPKETLEEFKSTMIEMPYEEYKRKYSRYYVNRTLGRLSNGNIVFDKSKDVVAHLQDSDGTCIMQLSLEKCAEEKDSNRFAITPITNYLDIPDSEYLGMYAVKKEYKDKYEKMVNHKIYDDEAHLVYKASDELLRAISNFDNGCKKLSHEIHRGEINHIIVDRMTGNILYACNNVLNERFEKTDVDDICKDFANSTGEFTLIQDNANCCNGLKYTTDGVEKVLKLTENIIYCLIVKYGIDVYETLYNRHIFNLPSYDAGVIDIQQGVLNFLISKEYGKVAFPNTDDYVELCEFLFNMQETGMFNIAIQKEPNSNYAYSIKYINKEMI